MIDICDFAVGLSRQLYGRTIASERPGHRLMETWHPLGVVGVITAFNFPVAVWSWNAAVALVCGDTVVWKPSELTPLTALACHALLARADRRASARPPTLSQAADRRRRGRRRCSSTTRGVALLSATGSTRMGRAVGPRSPTGSAASLLELGGNNAAIVTPVRRPRPGRARHRVLRGRHRRPALHHAAPRHRRTAASSTTLVDRLAAAYGRLPIGDPLADGTLVGPLIHERAYDAHGRPRSTQASAEGGTLVAGGGRALEPTPRPSAFYVAAGDRADAAQTDVVAQETFAPILYVLPYDDLDEAIALNNAVPQGLSSSDLHRRPGARPSASCRAEGSDCGIANVNIGTSGAEIGGAFGGEKETGGGRESGSDAWRAYMRAGDQHRQLLRRAAARPERQVPA